MTKGEGRDVGWTSGVVRNDQVLGLRHHFKFINLLMISG